MLLRTHAHVLVCVQLQLHMDSTG